VDEPLIERKEVVALVFNVSDIASSLAAKKKLTEAERAGREAQRAQMVANAQRTRELAERAQTKLDAKTSGQ
jgi:hypothetical protein